MASDSGGQVETELEAELELSEGIASVFPPPTTQPFTLSRDFGASFCFHFTDEKTEVQRDEE